MATTIKQIETALRATGGFVSQAAKKLGISQSAVSNRLAKSEYLRKIREEIEESYLDLAESKLIKKINNDESGPIFFYLKCKGKKRGYIENHNLEVTTKDGAALQPIINVTTTGNKP